MECLDPDRTSWIELNAFAWRLGYRVPPVLYWFKHPTNDVFWPICDDMDAVKMLELLPQSRIIKVYYVGGGTRQIKLCELEDQIENYEERIPHVKFKPKVRSLPLYGTCYLEVEIDKKVNKGKQKEKVVALVGSNNEEEHNTEEHKGGAQDESDDEDEFVDIDYEIRPEDDPEFDEVTSIVDDHDFVAHVDNEDVLEEFADMGYAGEISDHSIDIEELGSLDESSESDNGEVTSKRKTKS